MTNGNTIIDRQLAAQMYCSGSTQRQIAEQFGVTKQAVSQVLLALGIDTSRRDTWTAEEVRGLRTGWALGLGVARIGARIGRTKDQVAAKAQRLELPKRAKIKHFG